MNDKTTTIEKLETQSSIFQKTGPDLRRRLDQAVIDHDPPTYKAIYNKFDLAAKGISFMAFYRYARRRRTHAALIELPHQALPEDCDAVEILPKLLAHRLLDAAADDSTSPGTLQRLTDAWRIAARTYLILQRHQTEIEQLRKKANRAETDELCKVVKQYASLVRAQQTTQKYAALSPSHEESAGG